MVASPSPAVPGPPDAEAPVSTIGRIFGALFSPKQTFADIAQRPSWIAPVILLTLFSIGVSVVLNQRVDWGSFIRQKAEQNPRFAQLSDEQKQNALGMQVKIAPMISYAAGVLGPVLSTLIFAGIYLGAFNLFAGAQLRYGTSMGITAHAFLPSGIASLLAIVIGALKPRGDLDPEHILASNLGSFLSSDAPKWLVSLASSFELFWIWVIVLLAIGFRAANPKKISTGQAFGIVIGLWVVWLFVKVGWAAIFS